jgi:hypothetical protein
MSDAERLLLVRALHTVIYVTMATSVFVVLYAGVTGAHGPWLPVAAGLVGVESLVFAACGWKCPLTAVAVRYGARHGEVFDTFLPEAITRHTFRVFGPLIGVGVALVAARGLWFGWAGP